MRDVPRSPRPETASELQRVLEADRGDSAFVFYRDEDGVHEILILDSSGPLTIGRKPGNDLALVWDGEVSRVHATLDSVGGEWMVSDDGLSSNGTFLNGARISGRKRLRDGDMLRCGKTTLMFRQPLADADDKTTLSGEMPPPEALTPMQRKILVALARPYGAGSAFATPAGNQQIADELCLSVDAVKTHLRVLFQKFGLQNAPRNEKRVRLVESTLRWGLVGERELHES